MAPKVKNEIRNFYEIMPDKFTVKVHNPNIAKHKLDIPFRMVICGPSGSLKTNTVLEILKRFSEGKGTFNKVVVCTKSKSEPLYEYLEETINKKNKDGITFFEGYDDIPDIDYFEQFEQSIIIFDDLALEKDQRKISEFYIRGRKKGISCVYLTQSYFKCPKVIRQQCRYIILKKLGGKRDLRLILSEFTLGVDLSQLVDIYQYATKQSLDFLLIDTEADEEHKFRKNFLEFI
jgi:hypothetical protein